MKQKRITIAFESATHTALVKEAVEQGITISDLVEDYCSRQLQVRTNTPQIINVDTLQVRSDTSP